MTILKNYSDVNSYFTPEKIVEVGLDAAKEIVWNIFLMENNGLSESFVCIRNKNETAVPEIVDSEMYEWRQEFSEKKTIVSFYLLDDFGNGIIDVEIQ